MDGGGLEALVVGHRWPAGRGEAQFDWEPPRTKAGVPNRGRRLKALGNAVVSQCAYVVGRRIVDSDSRGMRDCIERAPWATNPWVARIEFRVADDAVPL